MRLRLLCCALLFGWLLGGPLHADPGEINFGIISTESAQLLRPQWDPLLNDMEKQTGLKVKAFFASDYAGIIEAMRFGKVQLAYFGNKSAMEAVDRANAEIFAKVVNASGVAGYYSVLIARADSGIESLDDLLRNPGKYSFGNGDPNSTSGFLVPNYYAFAQHGTNPKTLFRRTVAANHETNLMAVLNHQVDVATNNTNDLEKLARHLPERIKEIRVIWTSPLIPADPLVWRSDLDEQVKAKLRGFFLSYGSAGDPEAERHLAVLKVLTFTGFHASSNDQLLPIRQIELFRSKALLEADDSLTAEEKQRRTSEIDGKLAQLQKRMAGQ